MKSCEEIENALRKHNVCEVQLWGDIWYDSVSGEPKRVTVHVRQPSGSPRRVSGETLAEVIEMLDVEAAK